MATGRPPARIVLLALALALAGTACRSQPAPRNVVIVLVDTLRPERLGAYGDSRGLTPAMDGLAAQGTVYRNAYAQTSWTNPSVAALFTSRFQSQTGMLSFGSVLDEQEQTFAELLAARGYESAGFVSNILVQKKLGFAQGFDRWQIVSRRDPAAPSGKVAILKGRGDDVNRAVFKWLDQRADRTRPVFLYVHYMEPHAPYDPPPERVAQLWRDPEPPDRQRVNSLMELPGWEFPDELVPHLQALYDAEVASVDTAIGALVAGLRTRGVLDNAVLVLLADHGEELKEHGLVGHHQTLYEEVIRVPLIVVDTARPQPRVVEDVVSIIDVAPTLAALVGAEPPASYEGRSLAATVGSRPWWRRWLGDEEPPPSRPAYSELIKSGTLRLSPHERAAIDDGTKLITNVDGSRSYYDLRADPGERNPDALAEPQRMALDRALEELRAYAARREEPAKATLDAETRERMRALGYVE